MQTISRMRLVLPQGFLKLTTNPSALTFHAQNRIFSLSRSMSFGNALQNSRCLLNQRTFSTPFVKPLKNPNQQIRSLETVVNSSNLQSASGEVHVIVGPMFAGKTTTLLRRIKTESCNGRPVLSLNLLLLLLFTFNFAIFLSNFVCTRVAVANFDFLFF